MSERAAGLYRLLAHSWVYDAVQALMGPGDIRDRFLGEHVRARPGDRILDIGSGTSTLLAHLPEVEYVGFEPNAAYVETARKTYGGRGTFHHGVFDADAAAAVEPVDIAIIAAVLHHLGDEEARELFRLLRGVMKPGGRVVTLDNVYVEGQNPIARLLIGLDRGRDVRTPNGYAALAQGSFERVEGAVVHRRFPPYTYWIMTASGP